MCEAIVGIQRKSAPILLLGSEPIEISLSEFCQNSLRIRRVRVECECCLGRFSFDIPVLARSYREIAKSIGQPNIGWNIIVVDVYGLLEILRGQLQFLGTCAPPVFVQV